MKQPQTFGDIARWSRAGNEHARSNLPRRPGDDAPPRALLRSMLSEDLRAARRDYLEAVGLIDEQRFGVVQHLRGARQAAKTDARVAASIGALSMRQSRLDEERQQAHDELREVVEAICARAETADAAWRRSNERSRDRRISISPTPLAVPATILAPAPDPVS